jgi:hypothetical protein
MAYLLFGIALIALFFAIQEFVGRDIVGGLIFLAAAAIFAWGGNAALI